MEKELISYSRTFQVWLYNVGHRQLLLRSTKDSVHPTRVDVLFKNVDAINLPTVFDGLKISEATEEDARQYGLQPDVRNISKQKAFLITGSGYSGYVVAALAIWHEDELEYYDKSFFSFSLELPVRPFYSRIYLLLKIRLSMFFHRRKQAVSGS